MRVERGKYPTRVNWPLAFSLKIYEVTTSSSYCEYKPNLDIFFHFDYKKGKKLIFLVSSFIFEWFSCKICEMQQNAF